MNTSMIPFRGRFGATRKKLILFLSTGNTCRAPMAAGYLRKLLRENRIEHIEVRSAGVMTVPGLRASQEAVQIMTNEGVDLSIHRSSQLTPEVARKADLILGMTPLHIQEALKMANDVRGKAYLLKEYAKSDLKNSQISDPMGNTLEVFKKCFREIRQACERLMEMDFIMARALRDHFDRRPFAPVRKVELEEDEDVAEDVLEAPVVVAKVAAKATVKTVKPTVQSKPAAKKKAATVKVAAKKASKPKTAAKPKAKSPAKVASKSKPSKRSAKPAAKAKSKTPSRPAPAARAKKTSKSSASRKATKPVVPPKIKPSTKIAAKSSKAVSRQGKAR